MKTHNDFIESSLLLVVHILLKTENVTYKHKSYITVQTIVKGNRLTIWSRPVTGMDYKAEEGGESGENKGEGERKFIGISTQINCVHNYIWCDPLLQVRPL